MKRGARGLERTAAKVRVANSVVTIRSSPRQSLARYMYRADASDALSTRW